MQPVRVLSVIRLRLPALTDPGLAYLVQPDVLAQVGDEREVGDRGLVHAWGLMLRLMLRLR
jgi:hypothetical protein